MYEQQTIDSCHIKTGQGEMDRLFWLALNGNEQLLSGARVVGGELAADSLFLRLLRSRTLWHHVFDFFPVSLGAKQKGILVSTLVDTCMEWLFLQICGQVAL